MRLLFSLALLLALSLPTNAQQFSFIHHSIEDGLAQSQVRAIAQDHQGYLWFATMGGVSRFDGTRFYNYSTEQGLVDNQINCIYTAANQDIWFGCAGGISRFNGMEFVSFPFPAESEHFMVVDMEEIGDGEFLLATNGAGLMKFSASTGSFSNAAAFRNDVVIRKILRTESGDLIVGARSGLYRMISSDLTQKVKILENHYKKEKLKSVNYKFKFTDHFLVCLGK